MNLLAAASFVTFALVIGSVSAQIPSGVQTDIKNGVNAANAIVTFIHDSNFTQALTSITGKIAPFLGALGPIVTLVLGIFGKGSGPSAELKFMQDMMKRIDSRFNSIDSKLAEIGRKVDHLSTESMFGPIENNVHITFNKLNEFYQASFTNANDAKTAFVNTFKAKGIGNAQNIYEGLMNNNNIFSTNLGTATMNFVENDRRQTQRFLMGLLNLLLNAVKCELSYLKASGQHKDSYIKSQKDSWATKIKSFKDRMLSIDRQVAAKWNTQSKKELDDYIKNESANRNNQDLANFMYNKFHTKYYWRDWLVIVYNDLYGDNKHFMHTCEGWALYRQNKHNIVVASVDKTVHPSSSTQRSRVLSVPTRDRHEHRMRGKLMSVSYTDKSAHDIYNSFSAAERDHCSPFRFLGVIQTNADVHHYPASSPRLTFKASYNFYMVAFG